MKWYPQEYLYASQLILEIFYVFKQRRPCFVEFYDLLNMFLFLLLILGCVK